MTKHLITAGEVQLAGHVFGSGQPLVMIHGFPLDHSMWQAQIEALPDNYQTIAPDLRGFGESAAADGDASSGVDMQTFAADLVAVLDELQITEPVILCGFSMGGYILWQFLQQYPHRVRAVVLCDTRASADSPEAAAGREQMASKVLNEGIEPLVVGMLPKLLAASTQAERPEIVEQVATMIRKAPPAAVAAALRGMARRPDVVDALPTFDLPALVVAGADDAISTPAEMQAIATRLPQAKFVEIADAGHLSPLENPTAFNEALRAFIESL
ncbi:MAG: alpha/beta fold hydrolase [Bythopirellula sp.]